MTYGDIESEEQAMSPIITRYLLSVVVPTLGLKNIPPGKLREMRTIAMAVDMLLKGRSDSTGDILLQRFMSIAMSVRDGSDQFGPQIELLPQGEEDIAITFSPEAHQDRTPGESHTTCSLRRRKRRGGGEDDAESRSYGEGQSSYSTARRRVTNKVER